MEENKMISLIKKGKIENVENCNKFERYNLKENPFPATPFVNQENSDKRYNGEIYEEAIRSRELGFIEDNFLKILKVTSIILGLDIYLILLMLGEEMENQHLP